MKGKLKHVESTSELSFENTFQTLLSFIDKYWDLSSLKPKNYEKFLEKGEEQQPQNDYKSFEGFDNGSATTFNFPQWTSPTYAVFNELHNATEPSETLLNALFAYAFQVGAKYQELHYKENLKEEFKRLDDLSELAKKSGKSLPMGMVKDAINNHLRFNTVV